MQPIYLDNAATTHPKPEVVYVQADQCYRASGANAGRGNHSMARNARGIIEETRGMLARLLHVPESGEVIFQPSATHALNATILGAGLTNGQVAYVTPFEHNSVLRPVEHLRVTRGIAVREVTFSGQTCLPDMPRVRAQFAAEPPDLLIVSQASNVTGALLPATEIVAAARRVNPGVIAIVDGSQAAGLYDLASTDLFDALIFSGHKTLYGPYGAAGFTLYGTRWRPAPIIFGGTGTMSETLGMPDAGPGTFEAGSQNVWAIAGLRAALRWIEASTPAAIRTHSGGLSRDFAHGIGGLPGVRVIVPSTETTAVVSFTIAGVTPQIVENTLSAAGIAVRSGLHCAPWAHRLLGTLQAGGTVRVSPGYFNTPDDIGRAVDAVSQIAFGSL